jgi:hypothetical protein
LSSSTVTELAVLSQSKRKDYSGRRRRGSFFRSHLPTQRKGTHDHDPGRAGYFTLRCIVRHQTSPYEQSPRRCGGLSPMTKCLLKESAFQFGRQSKAGTFPTPSSFQFLFRIALSASSSAPSSSDCRPGRNRSVGSINTAVGTANHGQRCPEDR